MVDDKSLEPFLNYTQKFINPKASETMKDSLIIITDKKSKIVYVNHTYEKMIGISKEMVLGRNLLDIEPNSGNVEVLKNGYIRMGRSLITNLNRRSMGSVYPISEGNDLKGAISIFSLDNKNISRNKKTKTNEINLKRIIGNSEKFNEIKKIILKVSPSNTPVLITGESGVGKELVAEAIHYTSPRRNHPFISINCAAIPEHLLESELFGYEAGAFTGAKNTGKIGRFELANKGTLFLDEIGEMSLEMQTKLLRAIQNKEIERIGGHHPIPVDFRIVSATNKDLRQMVEDGKFREDLYYRLNVIPIEVPPLRERKEDIPRLCSYFLNELETGKILSDDTLNMLINYRWPGNIRQLRNVLEYASIMSNEETIDPDDLPLLEKRINKQSDPDFVHITLDKSLEQLKNCLEKKAIHYVLKHTNYNKTEASKKLGISRQALYIKAKKYGIKI